MLNDGIIGNKSILLALGAFATGNLNAKLKQGARTFSLKDIAPLAHDYIIPPLTPQEQKEQVSQSLLMYIASFPGAEKYGIHPK